MDEPHRSITLARVQKRVLWCLLIAPAHLALDLAAIRHVGIDYTTIDLHCLFLSKFILTVVSCHIFVLFILLCAEVISLFHRRGASIHDTLAPEVRIGRRRLSPEILDSELEPPQFDSVPLVQLVVLLYVDWPFLTCLVRLLG